MAIETHAVKALPPHVKLVQKKALDPLLKCPLCTGFFRDAHTINECLCSFCKACIYKYYHGSTKRETCPACDAKLGGKPLKSVIADTSLQKIVDLLYPQFRIEDQKAIREMYRTFKEAGTPLPRDSNLVDYGFNLEDEEVF